MGNDLMAESEIQDRVHIQKESRLDVAIDKWERVGLIENWPLISDEARADDFLNADTCALCDFHHYAGEDGPKKFQHCLSSTGGCPCPLVEKEAGNIKGCTHDSPWRKAKDAAEIGDRKAFMKARKSILAKLKRAKEWY